MPGPTPASPSKATSIAALFAFKAATECRQVIVARCILQVLKYLEDNFVWNCGQQPIVKGDVLDLGIDCHSASLSQRGGGHALAFPEIGRDGEAKPYHLPLDC